MRFYLRIEFINVNCRIGSLEIKTANVIRPPSVNCRIGSLENQRCAHKADGHVNCRIGSLEIKLGEG